MIDFSETADFLHDFVKKPYAQSNNLGGMLGQLFLQFVIAVSQKIFLHFFYTML